VADTGGRPGCSDRHASLTLPRRPDAYPAGVDQASPRGSETVRLQPTTGFGRVLSPRDLWRYRDLALQIAVRDITVRYRQTALGAAWAVLQPIGFMIVFTLIFGKLAGISSEGLPYALFSLAALVPWTYFATAVQLGSDSLVSNSQLVAKIYFPRIFIPSAVVVAGLVDIAIAFAILLVLTFAWGIVPPIAILLVPLLVLIAAITALGVGTTLAALNVRYRDIRYVVPFGIQLWLFATPVAYSVTLLAQPWRTIVAINPMVGVVEGFRWAVLGGTARPELIAISAASALVILFAGLAYFDRAERGFADYV
jgi:lipopolysaccharide transport system permease protein